MRRSHPPAAHTPVSVAVQDYHIRRFFPGFSLSRAGSLACWRGRLTPRPSAPAYSVVVRYAMGDLPKVFVVHPKLAPDAPHVYSDGHLCLYWPGEWHWHGERLIADSILPWTSIWLFYYELWLDTGTWLGPEVEHAGSKVEEGHRVA